eukprot:658625-Hanusia_phi.AAC.2
MAREIITFLVRPSRSPSCAPPPPPPRSQAQALDEVVLDGRGRSHQELRAASQQVAEASAERVRGTETISDKLERVEEDEAEASPFLLRSLRCCTLKDQSFPVGEQVSVLHQNLSSAPPCALNRFCRSCFLQQLQLRPLEEELTVSSVEHVEGGEEDDERPGGSERPVQQAQVSPGVRCLLRPPQDLASEAGERWFGRVRAEGDEENATAQGVEGVARGFGKEEAGRVTGAHEVLEVVESRDDVLEDVALHPKQLLQVEPTSLRHPRWKLLLPLPPVESGGSGSRLEVTQGVEELEVCRSLLLVAQAVQVDMDRREHAEQEHVTLLHPHPARPQDAPPHCSAQSLHPLLDVGDAHKAGERADVTGSIARQVLETRLLLLCRVLEAHRLPLLRPVASRQRVCCLLVFVEKQLACFKLSRHTCQHISAIPRFCRLTVIQQLVPRLVEQGLHVERLEPLRPSADRLLHHAQQKLSRGHVGDIPRLQLHRCSHQQPSRIRHLAVRALESVDRSAET